MICQRIDWADVYSDNSSDQNDNPPQESQKPIQKEVQVKEPKKRKTLKIVKVNNQREEIEKKRLDHKTQQLKLLDEIKSSLVWLYVFKNPNPELIKLVESYPCVEILQNQLGWDLKITKVEARKLLLEGFGSNKVFGRMQISRRNYEKETKKAFEKKKGNKIQNKVNEKSQKQSNFKKNKGDNKNLVKDVQVLGQNKLKYKEKLATKQIQLNHSSTEPQLGLFEKQILKLQSLSETAEGTLLLTQTISQDKLTESLFEFKQFDQLSMSDNLLKDITELNIPRIPSDQSQIDSAEEISYIQDLSTIQILQLDHQLNQQSTFTLIEEEETKKKKKKKNKNKQPKGKQVSNNPFDKLC